MLIFFMILQQKSSRDIPYPILYSLINFNLLIYSVNDALDFLYTIINFQPVPVPFLNLPPSDSIKLLYFLQPL